jgi:hypothetical protein
VVHLFLLLPPHTSVSVAGQHACCRLIVQSSSIHPQPLAPTNHLCTPTLSPRHRHALHTQPASIALSFNYSSHRRLRRVVYVFGESLVVMSPTSPVVATLA